MRQLHDIEQANVPFPALYPAHIVPMQLGQLGELLLRDLAFLSQLADAPSEYDSLASDTFEQVWQALL
jgi:hypothetical protein